MDVQRPCHKVLAKNIPGALHKLDELCIYFIFSHQKEATIGGDECSYHIRFTPGVMCEAVRK
jgi:hypothetical protein